MTDITRKNFLKLAGASLLASTVPVPARASTAFAAPRQKGGRTLIRGADLLSMDPKLGELRSTDVLIEDNLIKAIGSNLTVADAHVIDARGMILMPGMIDGHRHTWQSLLAGVLVKTNPKEYRNYFEYTMMKVSVGYRPEDVFLANYFGGLTAIDTGVTSVLDHAHITTSPEKAQAAAEGLIASGIGGIFGYQLSFTPTYRSGRVPLSVANNELMGAPDAWHFENAAKIRDKYFSSSSDPLQFGVGLSHVEYAPRTEQSVIEELAQARKLEPKLMTQHIHGVNGNFAMGLPASYRVITALGRAGVLGPDYHISHGNGCNDEELKMLAGAGSKVTSTALGEFPYEAASIHGRAWKAGIAVGIGIDVAVAVTTDYFEHMRAAWMSLYREPAGRAAANEMRTTDILSFATLSGARSLGIDSVTGSVTVGKRADLVLLRTDRVGFPIRGSLADRVVNFASLQDIDSVWTNGQLRKHKGKMVGADLALLKQKSDVALSYILQQADAIEIVK